VLFDGPAPNVNPRAVSPGAGMTDLWVFERRARTLDLCLALEGSITLVLDTTEVSLAAGDVVVQRGTNHAWSNRSSRPCVIAISSHDAA
jgi:uncharacterized cupin superfamily protein